MKRRWLALCLCIVLIPLLAWALGIGRQVRYVFLLPNDFSGLITVVYHPEGKDKIHSSLFGKKTFTLTVPESGVVVTSDRNSLHYLYDDEEWKYQDGRIIKKWPDKLASGFIFIGSRGAESRGTSPNDPLRRFAVWDKDYWRLDSMRYEVVKSK
jgi:hypothetical protein